MYDTIGAAQFALLTLFFGLREHHKLLEVGAGSLRAGRLLIQYLAPDNYCGVEPLAEAIEQGLEHEVGRELTDRKRPRFHHGTDFDFGSFGETFDYALSYSVFTHLPPTQLPRLFERLAEVSHEKTILLATAAFCDGDDERIVDPERWTDRPINIYSAARLQDAAARAGFAGRRIGHVFQDWFVAFRDDNEVAIRGAEQATKVDWSQVEAPWQDPITGLRAPPRSSAES